MCIFAEKLNECISACSITQFYSILLYIALTGIGITGHFKTDIQIFIYFFKEKGCFKKLFLKAQNKKAHKNE